MLVLETLTAVITNVFFLNSTSQLRIPSESNDWLLSYSNVYFKNHKLLEEFMSLVVCSLVAINRAINNTMSINGKNYYFFLYIKTEFVHKFSSQV